MGYASSYDALGPADYPSSPSSLHDSLLGPYDEDQPPLCWWLAFCENTATLGLQGAPLISLSARNGALSLAAMFVVCVVSMYGGHLALRLDCRRASSRTSVPLLPFYF